MEINASYILGFACKKISTDSDKIRHAKGSIKGDELTVVSSFEK